VIRSGPRGAPPQDNDAKAEAVNVEVMKLNQEVPLWGSIVIQEYCRRGTQGEKARRLLLKTETYRRKLGQAHAYLMGRFWGISI
jgi:hypothetical protein